MRFRISRIARESSITMACMASPLFLGARGRCVLAADAQPVGRRSSRGHPLPPVVDSDGGLRRTEEQPAVIAHHAADPLQYLSFRLDVEVDEYVAKEYDIERLHRRERLRQVQPS